MTWDEILWNATFEDPDDTDTSYDLAEEKEIERYYDYKYN
ncbi:hypothetical protein SAMN05444362_11454 [Dysgonomonas macrotermitis]|uniref:Uncharacterized protein n=1 Tax=Dysgonomonas macrotermitis TaxID=1346286 RepID=A0A1M5GL87_9BACT|nr:hypothetical protein SAMN05444362_11454 [Dysgonomonas macrotermitis]